MEIGFKNLVRMSLHLFVFQGRIFARGNAPSGSASEQNPCTTRVFVSKFLIIFQALSDSTFYFVHLIAFFFIVNTVGIFSYKVNSSFVFERNYSPWVCSHWHFFVWQVSIFFCF
jgi:hypothetical protein